MWPKAPGEQAWRPGEGAEEFQSTQAVAGLTVPGWQVGALESPGSGSMPTVTGTTEVKTQMPGLGLRAKWWLSRPSQVRDLCLCPLLSSHLGPKGAEPQGLFQPGGCSHPPDGVQPPGLCTYPPLSAAWIQVTTSLKPSLEPGGYSHSTNIY